MTVRELIVKLQKAPQDAEVLVYQDTYDGSLYASAEWAGMKKKIELRDEDNDFTEERDYFVISPELE